MMINCLKIYQIFFINHKIKKKNYFKKNQQDINNYNKLIIKMIKYKLILNNHLKNNKQNNNASHKN